jgi:hypothetical protein
MELSRPSLVVAFELSEKRGKKADSSLGAPRQFFPDCTIAMCGYDFREGQEGRSEKSAP